MCTARPHILLQKLAGFPTGTKANRLWGPPPALRPPAFQVWGVWPPPTLGCPSSLLAGSNRENANLEAKLMSTFQKPLLWVPFILSFFPGHHLCSWAPILEQVPGSGPQQE